jgi:hypothetical protein
MEERAAHSGFVPLVPPPARRPAATASVEPENPVEESHELAAREPPHEMLAEVTEETPEVETSTLEPPERRQAWVPPQAHSCDHEVLIRGEAIRLAVIACGRALRQVTVIHPQLIAAFVDEALAAAGRADEAVVATNVAGRTLEVGEVAIEIGDARIEADIETRAALLVRAAADG